MVRAFYPTGLHIRFDFHGVFPFFEIDCGERRHLPIQAKKGCEIAGRESVFGFAQNSFAAPLWAFRAESVKPMQPYQLDSRVPRPAVLIPRR